MKITPRDDGRFEVGDRIFQTEAEAKAYLEGLNAEAAVVSPPKPMAPARDTKKDSPVWLQIVVGLVGAYMLFSCVSGVGSGGKSASSIGTSESGALTLCQAALKRASRDPATAEVPYVDDQGGGGEFYFAWGASTRPVRMKNGFGALLSTGASCTVNKQTGKITTLTLDGKTVM